MVAFTRLALLAGLLAGTSQATEHARAAVPHHKPRRQVGASSGGVVYSYNPPASTPALPSFSYSPPSSSSSSGISSGSLPAFSYAPTPTSTFSVSSPSTTNGTCAGKTLNVYEASLDWWYPQTYTYVASTFIVQYDSAGSPTGWVLEPAATPFDVTSAVQAPACTTTSVLTAPSSATSVCTTTYPPVAASTTVITQTAYTTITATTGTGTVPNLAITPPPAAITIPNSGGNYSAGTPFVFFSRYAIVTKSLTTDAAGGVGCAETTGVYNMSNPFSFEYTGGDVNGTVLVNEGVVGDVNPAFLGIVNVTSVVAGSWVAEPTVAVVVSRVIAVSEAYLATPTATLVATPTGTGTGSSATGGGNGNTAAPTLSPQTSLQLPTTAPATTQPATTTTRTTSINTGSPTNALEVLTQAEATFTSSPTNALGVLSQAEQTFPSNPTVSAILSGISGPQPISAAGSGSGSGTTGPITPGPAPALTIAGQTYIPLTGGGPTYVIAGQTLTPGGSIVMTPSPGGMPLTVSMNGAANSIYAGIAGATQTSAMQWPSSSTTGAGAKGSATSGVPIATGGAVVQAPRGGVGAAAAGMLIAVGLAVGL